MSLRRPVEYVEYERDHAAEHIEYAEEPGMTENGAPLARPPVYGLRRLRRRLMDGVRRVCGRPRSAPQLGGEDSLRVYECARDHEEVARVRTGQILGGRDVPAVRYRGDHDNASPRSWSSDESSVADSESFCETRGRTLRRSSSWPSEGIVGVGETRQGYPGWMRRFEQETTLPQMGQPYINHLADSPGASTAEQDEGSMGDEMGSTLVAAGFNLVGGIHEDVPPPTLGDNGASRDNKSSRPIQDPARAPRQGVDHYLGILTPSGVTPCDFVEVSEEQPDPSNTVGALASAGEQGSLDDFADRGSGWPYFILPPSKDIVGLDLVQDPRNKEGVTI